MSEEIQKDETVESTEAQAEETKIDVEPSKEEEPAKSVENEIDYEAELERVKKEGFTEGAASQAFKNRKNKSGDEEVEEYVDPGEKPLTKADLSDLSASIIQATQKEVMTEKIANLADNLTGSAVEKELVLEIHKNSTFPQHFSLQEQVESAYVIANRKKIIGENSELKRALKNSKNVNKNSAGTHKDAPDSPEPKVDSGIKSEIQRHGLSFNPKKGRYEKELPGGKYLVLDPNTQKIQVVK